MALFGKRNKKTIAELEEYYSGRNNKNGTAWIMALLSLLATVAVLTMLFFAGRWVYRTLTNTSDSTSTIQAENSDNTLNYDLENEDLIRTGIKFSDGLNDDQNTNSNVDDSNNISSNQGSVSGGAASTNESNADRLAAIETSTRDESAQNTNTDKDSSVIPNTGPGEALLVMPVFIALAGYVISIKRQLKLNK